MSIDRKPCAIHGTKRLNLPDLEGGCMNDCLGRHFGTDTKASEQHTYTVCTKCGEFTKQDGSCKCIATIIPTHQPVDCIDSIKSGIAYARALFAKNPDDFNGELSDDDLVAFIHMKINATKRESVNLLLKRILRKVHELDAGVIYKPQVVIRKAVCDIINAEINEIEGQS